MHSTLKTYDSRTFPILQTFYFVNSLNAIFCFLHNFSIGDTNDKLRCCSDVFSSLGGNDPEHI